MYRKRIFDKMLIFLNDFLREISGNKEVIKTEGSEKSASQQEEEETL